MSKEPELKEIFYAGFKKLKDTFYKNYRIEEREEDNSPRVLTLRDMIESLPPATQVIEITGPSTKEFLKYGRGFLFKYDFDYPKSDQFEFCGTIDYRRQEELIALLADKFKIDRNEIKNLAESLCKEIKITAMWNPPQPWYLHFISDDIIKNPEDFYRELFYRFLALPIDFLYAKFRKAAHPDYNRIFNLSSDAILSLEELIKLDDRCLTFNLSIEKLQERVSDLQLIPDVPDNVKQVLRRAKDLFIFGYFRYEFFTIAHHYAFLALEAAIKARYIAELGDVAILTDRKNKKIKHEMKKPTYRRIEEFCRNTSGWNIHTLLVNDEAFPSSHKKLLKWLVDKHIIRKWEKGSYDAGIELRNALSHLEHVSLHMPDSSTLQRVAEQINYLFYSLQKQDK